VQVTDATRIRPASADERLPAAALAYLSFREFYDLAGLTQAELESRIAEQVGSKGTELSQTFVAEADGVIAGMYSALLVADLKSAQMLSVVKLASALPVPSRKPFMAAVDRFRQGVPPIESTEGMYLSRIAVSPAFHRHGVGRALLEHFLHSGPGPAWLHVLGTNDGAIAFYRSHGFRELAWVENGYRLFVR
jgi:ribosomal protein S18 acetylase RimI-like enzyme